jgi:hypothetical protein
MTPADPPGHDADEDAPPARLWDAVGAGAVPHALGGGALGLYAATLRRAGAPAAAGSFPAVAAHLATGCPACREDLAALLAFLASGEA